ncbi:MAG: DUF58 domain-containing protein [Bacillota bacterium]
MVTKIKLKAFILLAALFFTALFVGGVYIYAIFIIAGFLLLASYIAGKSAYKNLVNIVWKSSDKIQAGSRFKMSMELYNSSFFPIPYLRISTKLSRKLTGEEERNRIFSLMPGEKTTIEKDIICKNKGIYRIGYLELEFGDAFGVFSWKMISDTNILLYVYPKVYDLRFFRIPLRQHFGTSAVRHNAYEDFASIKDIRKYENGDSIKKIHWKVTAHKGEFHVKNVDLNATADINVFMDLYEYSYEGAYKDEMEELAAECSASIARYALARNMSVSLIGKCSEYIRVSGTGINKFAEFLDAITKSEVTGDIPIDELVRIEGQKLNLGATAIIVTSNVSKTMLDTVLSYKAKGVGFVIVHLCENRDIVNNNVEALKQHGVVVYTVGIWDDIMQALGGQYEK